MNVCMYVCMCMYVRTCVLMYVYMYVWMYVCIVYIYMYACMYILCIYVCVCIYVFVCRYECVCPLCLFLCLEHSTTQHSTFHFQCCAMPDAQQPGHGLCEAHNDAVCWRPACCWIQRIRTYKFRPPISQLLRIEYLPPLNMSLTLLLLFCHLNTKEALAAN